MFVSRLAVAGGVWLMCLWPHPAARAAEPSELEGKFLVYPPQMVLKPKEKRTIREVVLFPAMR